MKHLLLLLAAMLAVVLIACGHERSPYEPEDTPGPAPSPTAGTLPVRSGPSRWGVRGTSVELAFLALKLTPGANPAIDPWWIEGLGDPFTCAPHQNGTALDFTDCSGLPEGASVTMSLRGENDLRLSITSKGRTRSGLLERIEDKEEAVASSNLGLLWHAQSPEEAAGGNTGLWADGGLVFAPHFDGAIDVLDAASGSRRSLIDISEAPGKNPSAALEVTAHDGVLYVATTSKGILVYDVRDPSSPRRIGQFMIDAGSGSLQSVTNVHTIFLGPDGRTLYAVNQSHATTDLRIIDVSDPASPREVGRFLRPQVRDVLDGFHDIEVIQRDGRLVGFLDSLGSGLFVLDVTDPRAVKVLGSVHWENTLSHSGAAFEVNGRLYYAHDDEGFDEGMTLLDMSDLTQPKVVSRYQTRRGTSIHNIQIVDNVAYVSYYVDGLRVVDLSDPARPREIAHYDTVPAEAEVELFQGAWGVHYLDGRVFISDIESGVFAFTVDLAK